jgi:hypothetical protein
MRLIETTARWVDPETFRLLPLWYPEHARRTLFYKADWSEPLMNKDRQTGQIVHKREGNVHANKALTYALGLRAGSRPNWSCCHIWGVDDASYQESNAIVQDRRFFSCIANMVLLPSARPKRNRRIIGSTAGMLSSSTSERKASGPLTEKR